MKSLRRRCGWLIALPWLMAMVGGDHRFYRRIEGAAGFTYVELPDEVLDRARPGLADVRILAAGGEEVPYAVGGPLSPSPLALSLFDVERAEKETVAIADRGAGAPRSGTIEIDVAEREFIKPITVEASVDRAAWTQIAQGTIFATASGARVTRLHFAPSDRRYWRLRFDDRHGPPLNVARVLVEPAPPDEPAPRVVALELKPEPDTSAATSTYAVVLPIANLPLRALELHATDPAFVRRARVYERVWFRDELSRRLLGEAEIARAASGAERTTITLSEPTSKHLEVEIDRAGVPLHDLTAEGVVERRVLCFHAPPGAAPELVYGSSKGAPPAYDLAAALRSGAPASFTRATLGPVSDTGVLPAEVPVVARGGTLDRRGWTTQQAILLPERGPIAYLDVERPAGSLRDLRIVDRAGRQVPYVVETEPRPTRVALGFRPERVGPHTVVHLDGIAESNSAVEGIELAITAPEYFSRLVSVSEVLSDPRGRTERRSLGNKRLVKAAGDAVSTFRVPILPPSGGDVTIDVDDGDNAPLVIASVFAEKSRRRVNFLFADGDELHLLSGNESATPPGYDLALVAERVLSSPAEPATLGEAHAIKAEPKPPAPAWFWLFVAGAAIILLFALARTLAEPRAKEG
jgi:hypothetical protein